MVDVDRQAKFVCRGYNGLWSDCLLALVTRIRRFAFSRRSPSGLNVAKQNYNARKCRLTRILATFFSFVEKKHFYYFFCRGSTWPWR